MYRVVEYNGYNAVIHSTEFEPNTMKILFMGGYSECLEFKNNQTVG